MPPDASDSSDDGGDFTETSVLLGFANTEATGDAVSHLGGQPTWLDGSTAPSGALAKCKVCNGYLALLLELNGDLPDRFPGHERRLYVWTCRRRTCRRKEGSVRSVRGVRIAKGTSAKASSAPKSREQKEALLTREHQEPQESANLGGALFGAKAAAPPNPFANPFSASSNSTAPTNPFSSSAPSSNPLSTLDPSVKVTAEEADATLPETFASKARLSSPPTAHLPRPLQPLQSQEPWPTPSELPAAFPYYYLDAEYETLDAPSTPQIPSNARMDIDGDSAGAGKEDKEVFESTLDKTFQKFADRIGQNPEQVLRYEFNGKPLLYSNLDSVGKAIALHSENAVSNTKVKTVTTRDGKVIPRCTNCGADRAFEVQLTPHAITELEAGDVGIEGMEWGTIIVGVCAKDCSNVSEGEVGYLEEWAGVQWEELSSKR